MLNVVYVEASVGLLQILGRSVIASSFTQKTELPVE